MARKPIVLGAIAAVGAVSVWFIATRAAMQEGGKHGQPRNRRYKTPMTADGKPDLSGIWAAGGGGDGGQSSLTQAGTSRCSRKERPCHPGPV